MSTHILRKCLEELNSEKPRIDYVSGMLETLIDVQSPTKSVVVTPQTGGVVGGIGSLTPYIEELKKASLS